MLDFTSALYLGTLHPTEALRPWQALSAGKPAALATPEGAFATARAIAKLVRCEHGTLLPSTFHAFWDLFGGLAEKVGAIYLDAGVYPIVRWGIERVMHRGLRVRSLPHYNTEALREQLHEDTRPDLKPALVVDGYCPRCGRSAPITTYLRSIRSHGGYLIMDDTQALGILGALPNPQIPYGMGGGGSLQWNDVTGADIIVISSLAKGFGVPVAVLAGSHDMVRWFEMRSETRVHCSPPSVAVIRAAEHALVVNETRGDDIRLRLAQRVSHFRNRLKETGLSAIGGLFPVQTLVPVPWLDVLTLHNSLLSLGVQTVLHGARNGQGQRLSFIITALHSVRDIDRAADSLTIAVETAMTKSQSREDQYEIQTQ